MANEQSAPNFFAVVNEMAKRFVELMLLSLQKYKLLYEKVLLRRIRN